MKFAVFCFVAAQVWAQIGPPPPEYAPPLAPGAKLEKFARDPDVYSVSVELDGGKTLNDSLKSAILLELRKRPDIMVTDRTPRYHWKLVCLFLDSMDLVACSSVGLVDLQLAEIEAYFPELKKYGVWWAKRALSEDGGSVTHHSAFSGPASNLTRFAERLVASFEAAIIEPVRQNNADYKRKRELKIQPLR